MFKVGDMVVRLVAQANYDEGDDEYIAVGSICKVTYVAPHGMSLKVNHKPWTYMADKFALLGSEKAMGVQKKVAKTVLYNHHPQF